MTREQKIERAKALRAQGWVYEAIGIELGYKPGGSATTAAYRLCHPERAREWTRTMNAKRHEAKLTWQRAKDHSDDGRARCTECGEPGGDGSARKHADLYICEDCRAWAAHEKYRALERLWNAGKTTREIAAELGWSKGYVSQMIDRAREAGYSLPYRYTSGKRKGAKFPEQRKAAA